jgi:hypothetical protein
MNSLEDCEKASNIYFDLAKKNLGVSYNSFTKTDEELAKLRKQIFEGLQKHSPLNNSNSSTPSPAPSPAPENNPVSPPSRLPKGWGSK